MIIGIGIDSVEIDRFIHWHTFSRKTLSKYFTQHELDYCLENPLKSAERFAARFAAKEACYKALSTFMHKKHTLYALMPAFEVKRTDTGITLIINKVFLTCKQISLPEIRVHISLTHTQKLATALIILEENTQKS